VPRCGRLLRGWSRGAASSRGLAPGLGSGGAGCKGQDDEKCQQALQTTRQALAAENFDLARQWRTYTYKQCSDAESLKAIDQEITSREAEVTKRRAEEEAKKKEHEQVVAAFTEWVGTHRAAPDGSAQNVACELDDDEKAKESKERFCTRSRSLAQGKYMFQVRYWEADPKAAQFMFQPQLEVACEKFGTSTTIRQWQVPATNGRTAARTRCSIAAGPLSGLQALATAAAGAKQYVFSPEYLQHDPGFAAKLTR